MVDCSLYRLNPAGHHFSSLFFHILNALLLFVFFVYTTGAIWRSFFVAALFAWHPIHVESVAWAAERKDVLSGFFFLLTLIAYSRYVRGIPIVKDENHLEVTPATRNSKLWYGVAVLMFALALMSKPMVVTLPFVLLLLDFWPLERVSVNIFARRRSNSASVA